MRVDTREGGQGEITLQLSNLKSIQRHCTHKQTPLTNSTALNWIILYYTVPQTHSSVPH